MIWDRTTPCASCPYRKDAPRKLWHRSEFENLLAQDGNEIRGAGFGCHEFSKRPVEQRRPCAGWMLDQKRRNVPSIAFRMTLMTTPEAAECFNATTPEGVDLFPSIAAMCRANGVRPR